VRACFAEPVDAVIHLAAIALSRAADPRSGDAWSINAEGTGRLTAALRRCRGAVEDENHSSCWRPPPILYAWQKRPIKEEDCVQPSTPYSASKLGRQLAEQQVARCCG